MVLFGPFKTCRHVPQCSGECQKEELLPRALRVSHLSLGVMSTVRESQPSPPWLVSSWVLCSLKSSNFLFQPFQNFSSLQCSLGAGVHPSYTWGTAVRQRLPVLTHAANFISGYQPNVVSLEGTLL